MLFILIGCDFGLDRSPTETDKQYEILLLTKIAGYEEWFTSIKGEKGDPGKDGVCVLSIGGLNIESDGFDAIASKGPVYVRTCTRDDTISVSEFKIVEVIK